jgi:hypothetical protein
VSADVLERVRKGCAGVMERARSVRIDGGRLSALARELAEAPRPGEKIGLDPAHHLLGDRVATLAYVLTLGAVNFGSGWSPRLRKKPGISGYFTLATGLREHFEARGPWSARELCRLDPGDCAEVFGQDRASTEVMELMALFARALGDLGRWLLERHGGRFEGPLEAAQGSAAGLVELLEEMPLYRDVSSYEGLEVPFYKRAQLTAADLAVAFGGEGWGCFRDLDRLTCFADNLVPHVLRCAEVLVYAPQLARRIDAGELLAPGSPEELEIRAGAVHAVERCVEELARAGVRTTAQQLDFLLWNRGQRAEFKAQPRHRTRTTFY